MDTPEAGRDINQADTSVDLPDTDKPIVPARRQQRSIGAEGYRLHDRFVYEKQGNAWRVFRLAP